MADSRIVATPLLEEAMLEDSSFLLLCWQCGSKLSSITSAPADSSITVQCDRCDAVTACQSGIWCSLAPARAERFRRFIHDYEFIRAAEGRGSANEEYYLGLPYEDSTGKNSEQWAIRARSFQHMEQTILRPLAAKLDRPLHILDLGAGNGWLSYRLALRGDKPVAVDLLVNEHDGLGAAAHFNRNLPQPFPRVQAELDHLPFPSSMFDLAIFNASFHYSEDYKQTFQEALRCTRSGGAVLIVDTPWYPQEASGMKMVKEKRAYFETKYGFPSDSINSLEFLTPDRLRMLQKSSKALWKVAKPFYGLRWLMRPLLAKLRNRRTPSRFYIYSAWVAK